MIGQPKDPAKAYERVSYMTPKPQIKVRKTIVVTSPNGFMTMDEDGNIDQFRTADELVKALKRRDTAAAKKGESTATLIEWRDMPEGFEPPTPPDADNHITRLEKVAVDNRGMACPKCGALPGTPCKRMTSFGTGQRPILKKEHKERYATALAEAPLDRAGESHD